MHPTTDSHSKILATAAGLSVPHARLALGFSRAGWASVLAEPATGIRSGTRIVASAVAMRLLPRRRVPAVGVPWHQPLNLGPVTLAVTPAGSGPGTALVTIGDAERVVLDARAAGGAAWGPFEWQGVPAADVVIVDSRGFAHPSAQWSVVVRTVRAWARGGRVFAPDPVVGAVLALDLAAGGVLATVHGQVKRALRRWATARLIARTAAADLLAETAGARPLTISDALTAGPDDLWIGNPAATSDHAANAVPFSRFGAPDPLLALVRACGARTVLDVGPATVAMAAALGGEGVEVVGLRPAQLALPGAA